MPLAVTVLLLVLGVTFLAAVAGYLIDKGEEREERGAFTRLNDRET